MCAKGVMPSLVHLAAAAAIASLICASIWMSSGVQCLMTRDITGSRVDTTTITIPTTSSSYTG